jgi:hypothetical protein
VKPTENNLPHAPTGRDAIVAAVRAAGYARVDVDEEPFRSGSLNVAFLGRLERPRLGT